tara:strand:+ start:579 stop:854 length:276 start_codon:yes stop_codon:yes gene_type:complete
MSAIKKMILGLAEILGREPTIHEQIDVLILSVVKDHLRNLQLIYQVDPTAFDKEEYDRVVKSVKEIQERNPDIFTFKEGGGDSQGNDDDYI